MKRLSYLLIVLFIVALAIPSLPYLGNTALAQDTLRVAKILDTQGDVKVFRAGGEKSFAAYKGMGLTQGDTIITGANGKVTLEVDKDKEMKIGANTQLMISELVQSLRNNADKSSFNLKAGQVYTKVKSQLSPGAKYEIRTPTAVMGVRGTQFFVSLSNGVAEVITLEGQVVVTVSQPVTGPDGTVTMQPIQIQVEPNQIFVQSPDAADPTQYNLATLTSNESLSLFVLETLQEINEQQPGLIDPQLLENLAEQIEQARQKQQQQQDEQQQQQQPQERGDSSSSGSGSDSGTVSPGDDEQTITISPIDALNVAVNDEERVQIHTDPEDAELSWVMGSSGYADVSLDGRFVVIRGMSPGSTIISITAAKEGYISATKYLTVTVYEGGDWPETAGYMVGSVTLPEGEAFTDLVGENAGKGLAFRIDGVPLFVHVIDNEQTDENSFLDALNNSLYDIDEEQRGQAEITSEAYLKITSLRTGPTSEVVPLKIVGNQVLSPDTNTENQHIFTSEVIWDDYIDVQENEGLVIKVGAQYYVCELYDGQMESGLVASVIEELISDVATVTWESGQPLTIAAINIQDEVVVITDALEAFFGPTPTIVPGTGMAY